MSEPKLMHNRFVHSNGSLNPPCTNLCPTIHHRQKNKFEIYRSALIVTNSNEIKKGSHQNGIKSAEILTQYSSYLQIYRSALIVTREPAKIGLKRKGEWRTTRERAIHCYLVPRVVHAGVVGVRRADVRHLLIGVPFRRDLTATVVHRRQRRGRGFFAWVCFGEDDGT